MGSSASPTQVQRSPLQIASSTSRPATVAAAARKPSLGAGADGEAPSGSRVGEACAGGGVAVTRSHAYSVVEPGSRCGRSGSRPAARKCARTAAISAAGDEPAAPAMASAINRQRLVPKLSSPPGSSASPTPAVSGSASGGTSCTSRSRTASATPRSAGAASAKAARGRYSTAASARACWRASTGSFSIHGRGSGPSAAVSAPTSTGAASTGTFQ